MLTLYLMRHAKSTWDDASLPDSQRPLNARGRQDAQTMGRYLANQELPPAVILSSSAKRARQTVETLLQFLPAATQALFYNELYQADVSGYMAILSTLKDQAISPVMIVGHNPTMEAALKHFGSGTGQHFPTAAIAQLAFQIEAWSELNSKTIGELLSFWKPKEIHA